MAQIVCYNNGGINLYSSTNERFLFDEAMDYDAVVAFLKTEFGWAESQKFLDVKRVGKTGCLSSQYTLSDLLSSNHAGSEGSYLHFNECVKKFLTLPVPVVGLDAKAWKSIKQAAKDSKWMPDGYMMNDWVSDVINFLKEAKLPKEG